MLPPLLPPRRLIGRRWVALRRTLTIVGVLAPSLTVGRVARGQGMLIAPNAVVVDSRTHTGSVTLVNNGGEAVEVALSTRFGYPTTDSTGAMQLRTFEVTDDSTPSAATWVRSFPARLIMQPGERRTVRVLVSPPPSLGTGEYWARLDVMTRRAPAAAAVRGADLTAGESSPARTDVQIGLNLEVHTLLALFYRHGAVNTGLALATPRVKLTDDSLVVRVAMHRTGNAAFVGAIRAVVRDAAGATVASQMLPLGVYYDLDPAIAMPRPRLAPGKYTVAIEATSARPDVAPALLLQVPPTKSSVELVVPDRR